MDLYERLKERVLELGVVEVKATKLYIAFISNGSNFVDVKLQKQGVKLFFNLVKGTLNDPYKLTRDVSSIGHHGNGDYELNFSTDEKLDYILTLVKQAYLAKV